MYIIKYFYKDSIARSEHFFWFLQGLYLSCRLVYIFDLKLSNICVEVVDPSEETKKHSFAHFNIFEN